MVWTTPRTFVAGEMIPAADLNLYVRDNLAFLKERIQAGTVAITPVAGTPTSVTVTFPIPFSSPPRVIISPATSSVGTGGTQVEGCGADSETTTQFRATILRNNTTVTNCRWVATLLDT